MEVYNDGKFNLLETDDLIVKNKLNYSIYSSKQLTEYDSGSLYLIDNSNENITINLPYIKWIIFDPIFTKTTNNSITLKTHKHRKLKLIIGSDWVLILIFHILHYLVLQ